LNATGVNTEERSAAKTYKATRLPPSVEDAGERRVIC